MIWVDGWFGLLDHALRCCASIKHEGEDVLDLERKEMDRLDGDNVVIKGGMVWHGLI